MMILLILKYCLQTYRIIFFDWRTDHAGINQLCLIILNFNNAETEDTSAGINADEFS